MSSYKRNERYKDSGVEWIGEIPEKWKVIKLKYVTRFAYGDSLPTENREEGGVDVFGSNGKVGTHNVANTLSPVIIVGRKGSYGKVTYSDKECFAIDTTYFIDKRFTKSNIKWLYYLLTILELDKNSQDTGVPGLSREYAYNIYVPVATINEQVAIAGYLEQKTAEIDDLIANKEKLIVLLQEKRQAIITEAVTKGLNTNVRMKNSGIEWIGEIPEKWKIIKLKYVTKLAYGDSLSIDNREGGEVDVFGSNGKIGTHKVANTLSPVIIVGRKGSYGKVTYSDKECFAIDTTYFIDKRFTKSNIKWLYYLLTILELDKNSQDTGVPGLSREYAYNMYVPVPTINEQVAIAEYLEQKIAEIDDLIIEIKVQIQKLKEYRQSLISEAVTGKIDVRDYIAYN